MRSAAAVHSPLMWIAGPQATEPLNFVVSASMAKSIRDSAKSKAKMGRPVTTGPGEPQVVRMHDEQLEAIDAWIAERGDKISRPEAIRRLVEIGLRAKEKQT
jgi:hypothetical protein